jgi:NAD(P)-dependent dehydrogenase (short-subunit alcohol dehydrogenase family)
MYKTLIIGGASGIGSVIKTKMIERGDKVYTASRRGPSTATHFSCKLPNPLGIDRVQQYNHVIFTHRYRGASWSDEFDVTVKAVVDVIDFLKDSIVPGGSIVILGSNAGSFVYAEQEASYHATRAALNSLMRYYAARLGPLRIRCNAVIPATLVKPENQSFYTEDNAIRRMIERITPLGRMGTAEDIANAVDFLCSDKSSFISGQSIVVDGGLSVASQESIGRAMLINPI